MAQRRAIPKGVRFSVFERDSFTCQYCGGHPPEKVLLIDHVVPVAKGGSNHISNLVTACEGCNLGKSARLIESAPSQIVAGLASEAAKAEVQMWRMEELEAQAQGYLKIIEEKEQKIEIMCWRVLGRLDPIYLEPNQTVPMDWYRSVNRFVCRLGFSASCRAMDMAVTNIGFASEDSKFRYFCAVCWGWIKSQNGGDEACG